MNRDLVEKPFTPEQIQRRQGTNGDVLDYIEGCTVIQRLYHLENSQSRLNNPRQQTVRTLKFCKQIRQERTRYGHVRHVTWDEQTSHSPTYMLASRAHRLDQERRA